MNIKPILEKKLDDCLFELKLRTYNKKSTTAEVQRLFGVCLGLRIALLEVNKLLDITPSDFKEYYTVSFLIQNGFGQMTRKQQLEYAWPACYRYQKVEVAHETTI